ncbi:alpha/beta hydrolase family protein [Streptomyces sp. NPDC059949]|uniref:alpha/beta hydrolase family protein n=1 Tax=Streptomyces sp. NPDC059949 TaxID=3347013 RepID=UPI003660F57C
MKAAIRYVRQFADTLGVRPGADRGLGRVRGRSPGPVTYAEGATPSPSLLIHGTADKLVPYSQSGVLAGALRSAGGEVTLQPVDGADHTLLGVPDVTPIATRSVAFLARHLGA